jgi:hypothetical protein
VPRGDLKLEMFCDADFAGLYKRERDGSVDSVRSRTGCHKIEWEAFGLKVPVTDGDLINNVGG